MGTWHKTGCVLCAQNCGLEIFVEENRLVKVRPDKENPKSKGYACRKGLNVIYHQYPEDRLKTPLKKVNGKFEPISFEQAFSEIAEKLKTSVENHGPRSFAYLGGSAQGGHLEAAYGVSLMKALGSQYFYSSGGQEFSGVWWLLGRMFGKQYLVMGPDEENTEMLIAWGWNGMVSHQMPRAPKVLNEIRKDENRILVAIDPRKSETAAISDIHLPIRPGTDSLLIKAMISIILKNGWENKDYIEKYVNGLDEIKHWFMDFDEKAAISLCELDYDEVFNLCRLMTEKRWSCHPDLGIYMGRHSVYNSYFMNILGAICGIFGMKGGNVFPGFVVPLGSHADERNPKVWKTVVTDMPPGAAGTFPPAVLPDEILNDNKDRLRSVIVSTCNPLRSWPDTKALEKAFSNLDLLVVFDIVMSETARYADYVIPCRTFYEAWDTTFFPMTYPEVYFQLRRPLVKPDHECLEAAQIFTEIADRMGFIPEIPEDVMEAAKGDRLNFGLKLMTWLGENPKYLSSIVFILGKTLGEEWDSAAKAALWGILMTSPKTLRKNALRAGFEKGPDLGDRIFQALIDTPQGLFVGKVDDENNIESIKTESGKIELVVPELANFAEKINADTEAEDLESNKDFPLILNAGRHTPMNMNTLMRNPEWNKGKRDFSIAISHGTADELGLKDGDMVTITTEAGSEKGELEVSDQVRDGMALIPHGFGLLYGDRTPHGFNVNYLAKHTNRDPLGTPMHRFVPCRIEKA